MSRPSYKYDSFESFCADERSTVSMILQPIISAFVFCDISERPMTNEIRRTHIFLEEKSKIEVSIERS